MTPARSDQEHIPTLLLNDPRVPDRSCARLDGGEDPLPYMLQGIERLNASGVRLIAIPCNTAHLWFDALRDASEAPLLHIIEAAADDLARQGMAGARIGLMGTSATLALGLYQQTLEKRGHSCILPSPEEIEALCMASIRAVKANRTGEAFAPAAECIKRLVQRGADAIVLGCTELPLAVPHAMRPAFGVVMTDSIDALALAAIERYALERAAETAC